MRIPRILLPFLMTMLLALLGSVSMVDTARGEKLYGVYDGNRILAY